MYILVDDKDVIVDCSNSAITSNEYGYIVDGVLYLDKNLSVFQTPAVTEDCIQKKCFCKVYQNCFGESCPHYSECHADGTNKAVYTNKSYGEVSVRDGKELITNQLKTIKPNLDIDADESFSNIANAIDTMLDDATVTNLTLGEGVTAYNGSGAVTGKSEVIEQVDELPSTVKVGDIVKCGDSIYIGEEI